MITLSARARKELAIMHVADAMRVLAALAITLYLVPLGGLLYHVAVFNLAWVVFFLVFYAVQVLLHLSLLRAADDLLAQPRPALFKGLICASLLLATTILVQVIVILCSNASAMLLIAIACGLFDLIALGTLLYLYVASYSLYSQHLNTLPTDRHTGFEVVLPNANISMAAPVVAQVRDAHRTHER